MGWRHQFIQKFTEEEGGDIRIRTRGGSIIYDILLHIIIINNKDTSKTLAKVNNMH